MPNIQLSMCLSDNDRTRPLKDGRIKADGIDLHISTAHPSEMFWRQLRVDRSRVDLRNRPEVRTLFPDPVAEGVRYYKSTGFYPINHCVVFQRPVYEKYPWAVLNVFKAFNEAKDLVHRQTKEFGTVYFELGLLPQEQTKVLNVDPYLYGVKTNRAILEAICRFSNEQGLTPRVLSLEEVFAPQTFDL